MSAPSLPRALVLSLSVLAVALLSTCGSKDSTSPSPAPGGPTFNFTFTMSGTSHTRTFTEVGTWNYRCVTHGGMSGTVIVDPSSAADSVTGGVGVGSGGNVFTPASVTIKPGGQVRWVLAVGAATNHTVTR